MEDSLQQPIRAVRFPLKLKFSLMLVGVLSTTVLTFIFLASRLIREDKSAYVFDAILMRTEQQAASLEGRLKAWQSLLHQPVTADQLTNLYPEVRALWYGTDLQYQREGQAAWRELPAAAWQITRHNDVSLLVLDHHDRRLVVELTKLTDQNSPFKLALFASDGRILLTSTPKSQAMAPREHWLWELLAQPAPQGVREINQLIVAYSKIPSTGWLLTSQIDQGAALAVAGYLVDKSIYFGMFILGIAILIGIFAVRPLTVQLEALSQMTVAVGEGDFSQRVPPRTHDEAGALADSFNLMAEKITRYMHEMQEKLRLENELKVAQLVQKAFFPPTHTVLPGMELKAFAAPASECGGDWWGHIHFGETTLVMIADATGHGVPAALLTATANACKEGLKALAELNPALPQKPSQVMQYLNRTICSSGDQIQMTCFVLSWHRPTRSLRYTNASHQPALTLTPPPGGEAQKEHLRPLLEANGPRLGQQADAVYTENSVELPPGASIILYTDGLTDATDPQGQTWGQRRFLKALLATFHSPDGDPRDVVHEMQRQQQRTNFEDDVTLVSVRLTS